MAKSCAYCDAGGKLTREHIWPNGFLKRTNYEIKFSAKANKTFAGDIVVSDVCPACNNGPLSRLDNYACELYDRRFAKFCEDGATVAFSYDYSLFLRWLLKVSYNSARLAGDADAEILSMFRNVIISENPSFPLPVLIYVTIIGPSRMLNQETGDWKKIYPLATRCGRFELPNNGRDSDLVLRIILINSFMFNIIIARSSELKISPVVAYLKNLGGVELSREGRMRLGPPRLPTHLAMSGVESWPR